MHEKKGRQSKQDIPFNRRNHNNRQRRLATRRFALLGRRQVDPKQNDPHQPQNHGTRFHDRHDNPVREFGEVYGCQGEVGRCEESGPYSVEEHKFRDAVVFIDAEDCGLLAGMGISLSDWIDLEKGTHHK